MGFFFNRMVRLVTVLLLVTCVLAEDKPWVWGKNHRNQRAFNGNQNDQFGNQYYEREKDREPTTRRPPTGQQSDEDFLNPDDLRNYNGAPNFGFPPLGTGLPPTNNYQPGYGPTGGGNNGQGYPTTGYPNNGYPAPNYPAVPTGGGYPVPYPGGYQTTTGNGFQNQGPYPNQGYPQAGQYPVPSGGGYPGLFGLPGLSSLFGLSGGFQGQGGFPGQTPIPGQQVIPNVGNQGGYPYPGFGGYPIPTGYPGPPGVPNQFPANGNYPQPGGQYPTGPYPTAGQYPTGQYVGCTQFGGPSCAGGQQGPYPGQYPIPYPQPTYPGQVPPGPFGITPYNRAAFDESDNNKNSTNKSLKAEGKSLDTSSPTSKSYDYKVKKT